MLKCHQSFWSAWDEIKIKLISTTTNGRVFIQKFFIKNRGLTIYFPKSLKCKFVTKSNINLSIDSTKNIPLWLEENPQVNDDFRLDACSFYTIFVFSNKIQRVGWEPNSSCFILADNPNLNSTGISTSLLK